MRLPSVDTLERDLRVERAQALKVRRLLDGRDDPETYKSVEQWVARCFHRPWRTELILCAANEILETCGVEAIPDPDSCTRVLLAYCNPGDMYCATLAYDYTRDRWIITSIDQYVEENERAEGAS